MVRADRLLQFITQLQSEESAVQRRRLLLRYIRKMTEARFVALFLLKKEEQKLVLLAHSGRWPLLAEPSIADAKASTQPLSDNLTIPLHGLFGAILTVQGLVAIPDLWAEQQSLSQERALAWPEGRVLLSPVRENSATTGATGLLYIAFEANKENQRADVLQASETVAIVENEGDLLVCIALLSAYLVAYDEDGPAMSRARREKLVPYDELDRAMGQLLRNRRSEQQGTLPELLYSLSRITDLYEIGLVVGADIDIHELHQHILSALSQVVLAQGSCLLLYQAAQQRFLLAISQGIDLPYHLLTSSLDNREMERLALRGPGETVAPILLDGQRLLLVTLSYNCILLGVAALAISESDSLLDERSLLLSYLGNVAALILKNQELRTLEVQEAIEAERNRIARDLHDGPIQNVAHILHRLQNIEHMLEVQSSPVSEIIAEVKRTAQILDTSLRDLRHDVASLVPLALEEQGFTAALEALIDEYREHNPHLKLSFQANIPALQAPGLQGAVFRCIQEALSNIRKHSQAKQVSIRLQVVQNMLVVEIHDDGIGFLHHAVNERVLGNVPVALGERESGGQVSHFGLRSMEERVRSVGGILELESHVGTGTLLKAYFPLPQQVQFLTNREREILRYIAQGMTNSEIALKLTISRETVKSHIHHIMRKLHVHDRTHAAVLATRQGWL